MVAGGVSAPIALLIAAAATLYAVRDLCGGTAPAATPPPTAEPKAMMSAMPTAPHLQAADGPSLRVAFCAS